MKLETQADREAAYAFIRTWMKTFEQGHQDAIRTLNVRVAALEDTLRREDQYLDAVLHEIRALRAEFV